MTLVYRLTKGSALTAAENDGNINHILALIAEKVSEGDSRLTNSRTPTAHEHAISDITDLATQLGLKASTAALTALSDTIEGLVADSDSRLTDARAIADGDYSGFEVTGGDAVLAAAAVAAAIAAGAPEDLTSIANAIASAVVTNIITPMTAGGYVKVNAGKTALEADVPVADESEPGTTATSGSITLDFSTPRWECEGTTGNITFNNPTNLPDFGTGEFIVEFGGAHTIAWPSGWAVPGGADYVGTDEEIVHFILWRKSSTVVHVSIGAGLTVKP